MVSRSQGSYIHIHLFDLKVQYKTQLGKVNTSKACVHHELKASNLFSCRPKLDIRERLWCFFFIRWSSPYSMRDNSSTENVFFLFYDFIGYGRGIEIKSKLTAKFCIFDWTYAWFWKDTQRWIKMWKII